MNRDNLMDEKFRHTVKNITRAFSRLSLRAAYLAVAMLMVSGLLMAGMIAGIKNSTQPPISISPEQDVRSLERSIAEEAPALQVLPAEEKAKEKDNQEEEKTITALAIVETGIKARMPLQGAICWEYGWQEFQIFKEWRFHSGIDISPSANREVQAMYDGTVTDILQDPLYGLTVIVSHPGYNVYYGSLSTVAVQKNSRISAGSVIGKTGTSPAEPYEHLHLAVKRGDDYMDPRELLNNR